MPYLIFAFILIALAAVAVWVLYLAVRHFIGPGLFWLGTIIGLAIALYAVYRSTKATLKERKLLREEIKAGKMPELEPDPLDPKAPQPAVISYFFGPVYKDLRSFVVYTFNYLKLGYARITTFGWLAEVPTSKLLYVGRVFLLGVIFLATYLFGGAIAIVLSAALVVVALISLVVIYLLIFVVWGLDTIMLRIKGISQVCESCHNRFVYPVYPCPTCGRKHTKLVAGKYGVFSRRCFCGTKLPTSLFNRDPSRNDLNSLCPHCFKQGTEIVQRGGGSKPVVIPVVGATSVGKSAFITAYTNLLVNNIAPVNELRISPYDENVQDQFIEMGEHYARGSMTKTQPEMDGTRASAKAVRFFIEHPKLATKRLFHLYDIAGETFTGNDENEAQRQYTHADGVILIIDPFSIREVSSRYGTDISDVDRASISPIHPEEVVHSLVTKLSEMTGLSPDKVSKVPLAVVINKVDAGELPQLLNPAIAPPLPPPVDKKSQAYGPVDAVCRNFLAENGQADLVSLIAQSFKLSQFFPVSAMGHEAGAGEYKPFGVVEVIHWILRNTDKKLFDVVEPVGSSIKERM